MAVRQTGGTAFVQGFGTGANTALQAAQIRNTREAQRAAELREMSERFSQTINEHIDSIAQAAEGLAGRGIDPRSSEAMQVLGPLQHQALSLAADGSSLNLPTVPSPENVQARLNARINAVATPEEAAVVSGQASGIERSVEAETIAQVTDIPLTQVQESVGIRPSPSDPTRAQFNVDIIDGAGRRVEAAGMREDGVILVSDATGRFRPVREVFPDAQAVIPRLSRQAQVQAGEPLTREEVIGFGAGSPLDVSPEKAAGPHDAMAAALIRTPVISEIFAEIGGPGVGEEQRAAQMIMTQLSAFVRAAARPGTGRPSVFELELVEGLVPDFGAFATDRSVVADIQNLHRLANQELDVQLQIGNQPNRFGQDLSAEALNRAMALGQVVRITEGLLQAANLPSSEALQTVGVAVSEASVDQLYDAMGSLTREGREALFDMIEQRDDADEVINEFRRRKGLQ